MKGRLRLIIGIIISLACLYYVIRDINPRTLWEVYRGANYLYLIPGLLVLVVTLWFRGYRWRLLMHPDEDKFSLTRLFHLVNIGYLFNSVLPARVGEFVRAYLVGRTLSGGVGQALSSLVVERLLDVMCTVLLLVILLPLMTLPDWAIKGGLLLGAVSVVGIIVLLVLARFGERGLDWLWRFVGRIPWVGDVRVKAALRNLIVGFRVLTARRILPGVVLSSLAVWLGYAVFDYIIAFAFGLGHLSFIAIVFMLSATAFGMVLPASPGGVGPYEAGAVLALSLYGVEQSQAFGYAFGLHAFTNIVLILLGLWGLRVEGLTFGRLRSQVERQAPVTEAGTPQS